MGRPKALPTKRYVIKEIAAVRLGLPREIFFTEGAGTVHRKGIDYMRFKLPDGRLLEIEQADIRWVDEGGELRPVTWPIDDQLMKMPVFPQAKPGKLPLFGDHVPAPRWARQKPSRPPGADEASPGQAIAIRKSLEGE